MSTGMANLGEIDEAVNVAREAGAEDIVLLHCTSGYPTKPDEADILTIPNLIDAFGLVTGLSDHTPGSAVPIAAVTLGASVIEKHVTWRRKDGGPDAAFSLEPKELETLAKASILLGVRSAKCGMRRVRANWGMRSSAARYTLSKT